ncbi:hypothetical protein P7F60_12115 [Rhizobium sp. YJ-22]|uniref:hypothetical protein n=1 Tax=Rhizobium sp. YJ-22 TaxID=3037556 RepID=UPI002412A4ED|nr:hypothetical protein [Rhizobium sp. YJ-22]MDG3577138.1 hypothetical protein [Rhizobium sp. YJ-22]
MFYRQTGGKIYTGDNGERIYLPEYEFFIPPAFIGLAAIAAYATAIWWSFYG